MKKIILLLTVVTFALFRPSISYGQQDIGVVNIISPISSGCDIGTQQVQVDIFNFGSSTVYGSFNIRFQLNSETPVSQTDLNLLGFGSGNTRTITFIIPVNLNGKYGANTFKVYTQLGPDNNNANDTITMTITNYQPTNGGNLMSGDTVCQSANNGTLILENSIGDVQEWQSNIGAGFVPIAITDTFYNYTNISTTTSYRVLVDNGDCASAFSNIITIQVDAPPNAGVLQASKVICQGEPGDTLRLTNYFGNIKKWQSNNGSGWVDIANTDDTLVYGSLTQTTMYRAIVDTGVCNPDTSNIITITVLSASVGGNILTSDTVCANANSGTLNLVGKIGTVIQWEFSNDGFSWIPTVNTDTFLQFNNLTLTTRYRVLVQSASCQPKYSDTATITVNQPADAGVLEESRTVCIGTPSDTLNLVNYFGSVIKWQSNNGSGWVDIANTTDMLIYPAPTMDMSYRTIVDTGICGADTSNIVNILVVTATVGGNLIKSDTVCANNNGGSISLTNHIGNVVQWESSDDNGSTWVPIVNTDTFQIFNNLPNTRMYRVLVEASGCGTAYSDTAVISTVPQPIGGILNGNRSICSGINSDTLILENYLGAIISWQMNDGSGWINIINTSDSLFVSNLNVTTMYRVIVGNGICPNDTSTIATLTVITTTFGGNLLQSDSICFGNNNGTLTLSGHIGDIKWWEISENNGVTWSPIINEDTFQLYVNLEKTTWFRVLVEGTSCPNDYSDTVILIPYIPVLSISALDTTTFCEGDSVALVATAGYTNYLWSTTDTSESITATTTGSYKVTITDFRGCMNSDSIDVLVNPLPIADAGYDTTISLGVSVTLMGNGGIKYLWSPSEHLNNDTLQNPTASPKVNTTYTVLVTDINGCQNTDEVFITVNKDYAFGPKNLITPNGDGFNDTWKVDNLIEYAECKLTILNRYGMVVYESVGYDNSWNGSKTNGTMVSDGTYYYIITCEGTDKIFKGHITVLTK